MIEMQDLYLLKAKIAMCALRACADVSTVAEACYIKLFTYGTLSFNMIIYAPTSADASWTVPKFKLIIIGDPKFKCKTILTHFLIRLLFEN